MTKKLPISVKVNGFIHEEMVEPRKTLADFLRDDLELTGTHLGCEHGVCGACTILFDGEAVRSCIMLAVQADGYDIITVEGLAPDGQLTPFMRAMRAHHGMQCGFCTPGFVISATAFLKENPDPNEEEVRVALSGNICRCTGYQGIIDATLATAAEMRGEAIST